MPRIIRGRPTRWCSPGARSVGRSRSIRVLRPGHRHGQRPGARVRTAAEGDCTSVATPRGWGRRTAPVPPVHRFCRPARHDKNWAASAARGGASSAAGSGGGSCRLCRARGAAPRYGATDARCPCGKGAACARRKAELLCLARYRRQRAVELPLSDESRLPSCSRPAEQLQEADRRIRSHDRSLEALQGGTRLRSSPSR